MSLIADRETPIILFAGRPLASRKGLGTLLDALMILDDLSALPAYALWIVGGSDEEGAFLRRLAAVHPALAPLREAGRLTVWGHVEGEGMAELYSRSMVTVIPSTFEQFGLVAVEAMACGCPVVASRTGGLRDTVVEGLTGELVPVDCAQSLANVLTGYLRNPERSAWQGKNGRWWARSRFAVDRVYDRFYDLLAHLTPAPFPAPNETLAAEWRGEVIRAALPRVETLLGEPVRALEDVSDRTQTSVRVETGAGMAHVKILRNRPPTLSIVLPLPPDLRPPVQFCEIVSRYRWLADSGLTPPLLNACEHEGIVVMRWAEEVTGGSSDGDCDALMRGFAEFGEARLDSGVRAAYLDALNKVVREGSDEALAAFDYVSAALNRPLNGGVTRFHRTHPQVEVLRLTRYLESRTWAVSERLTARMLGVAKCFLAACPMVVRPPRLAHGSLKPAHVLRWEGRKVACDLDNVLYAVGPLDVIHWLHSDGRIHQRSVTEAFHELHGWLKDEEEFLLGVAWLLVYVLHRMLDGIMRGNPDRADRLGSYLLGFPEAAFATGLIR